MSKEQQGIVIDTKENTAKVKVARHGDCENCGACPGDLALVLEVINTLGAKKGDKVIFELREEGMVKATFIVYALPLILGTLGAVIGWLISKGINLDNSYLQVIGGILGFVISIGLIIRAEKDSKKDLKKVSRIIKILEK
ncbi:SoxR reducing system RseC family protein [Clostridium sp. YIM B02551]|uniref:SoxR reducing system RseC family protein n=1 Tax=Clostridium sp. YIM B02551 TaxID=2910679 RepID=UPI001EEA3D8E|nr:SoxR reducing system RseC family protein [Clostridium sp. YIM B02551]